jgi:hypothetical protein
MDDTTKFLKAWHKNQGPGERNEGQEKKAHRHQTAARLGKHATSIAAHILMHRMRRRTLMR